MTAIALNIKLRVSLAISLWNGRGTGLSVPHAKTCSLARGQGTRTARKAVWFPINQTSSIAVPSYRLFVLSVAYIMCVCENTSKRCQTVLASKEYIAFCHFRHMSKLPVAVFEGFSFLAAEIFTNIGFFTYLGLLIWQSIPQFSVYICFGACYCCCFLFSYCTMKVECRWLVVCVIV
ncbi:Hypothetical predicted protein [Octopus vulgaris]|uniref:Uncharacterized protein n=1 Tax=Octopus vulgaris TaxID=6645 RepID=A0AA36BEI0_OCTVU|nr:Hypothetical predicted protein [Octopus vulgaris]